MIWIIMFAAFIFHIVWKIYKNNKIKTFYQALKYLKSYAFVKYVVTGLFASSLLMLFVVFDAIPEYSLDVKGLVFELNTSHIVAIIIGFIGIRIWQLFIYLLNLIYKFIKNKFKKKYKS